jgi:pyruvate formate lyase activating enzyme
VSPPPSGLVFEIQRWCTDDGPGIRSTIFFQGCPLRCLWCCNPEAWCPVPVLDGGDPDHFPRGRRMAADEILAVVVRDRVFYRRSRGGVTFSGGEPTAQPDLLEHLARRLHAEGIHLVLETCGHFPWEPNAAALGLMDLVYLDLKHMDSAEHQRLTGVPNPLILDNAARLAAGGISLVLRLPLIPGYNDGPGNLAATAGFAARLGGPPIQVMPYHVLGAGKYRALGLDYPLAALAPPAPESVEGVKQALERCGATLV